ncbi:hypothetical protein NP233_g2319 [Leucocoprinus birnbaumii]|uniref:MARVEL domain-containing protein n=1 Tax=Leucocoprinus birnbaumii TaxID=56174 RepID=A0AAD5W0Z7_9AGAR|nr:hypothetical protein NP233_g2319 [Leucocoprinus birnbaumii]
MVALSPAGKTKLAAQGAYFIGSMIPVEAESLDFVRWVFVCSLAVFLFVINIVVLGLSAQVNKFQDFFYVADLFPLGLSIATLILLVFLLGSDMALENAYTARAHMEIGIFGILSVFWLSFSAFSTSRWRQIPSQCSAIPADLTDERTWCKNVQTLKGFVWIEFLACFIITLATFRYAATQSSRGNKHIWQMPLSRYRPRASGVGIGNGHGSMGRDSEFLQYGRFD